MQNGENRCYHLVVGIPGRKPKLDPLVDQDAIRQIREKVRFEDRPDLRTLAERYGFKSHRHLYFVAERYEASRGLRPDQKEEAPAASTD